MADLFTAKHHLLGRFGSQGISTKPDTEHPWRKLIVIYSNEEHCFNEKKI